MKQSLEKGIAKYHVGEQCIEHVFLINDEEKKPHLFSFLRDKHTNFHHFSILLPTYEFSATFYNISFFYAFLCGDNGNPSRVN